MKVINDNQARTAEINIHGEERKIFLSTRQERIYFMRIFE